MKQRFSEEQIIGILKQQESGLSTAQVCREHGICPCIDLLTQEAGGMGEAAEPIEL